MLIIGTEKTVQNAVGKIVKTSDTAVFSYAPGSLKVDVTDSPRLGDFTPEYYLDRINHSGKLSLDTIEGLEDLILRLIKENAPEIPEPIRLRKEWFETTFPTIDNNDPDAAHEGDWLFKEVWS